MKAIKRGSCTAALGAGLFVFGMGAVQAQGSCGVPAQIKGAQSVLAPVTLSEGQDLRVHLANNRDREATVSVAYFTGRTDPPIGRTEATLGAGERLVVDRTSACHLKVCIPGEDDEPYAAQAVVSIVYEEPVTVFKNPAAFDDPLVGFDDPLVGFDDPLVGFDDPLVGFDDPLVGFEVYDVESGRTGIWGNGGTYMTVIPAE